jgi:hypothetical protein
MHTFFGAANSPSWVLDWKKTSKTMMVLREDGYVQVMVYGAKQEEVVAVVAVVLYCWIHYQIVLHLDLFHLQTIMYINVTSMLSIMYEIINTYVVIIFTFIGFIILNVLLISKEKRHDVACFTSV